MSSWQDAFANFRISVERSWAISHVNLNMHGCDFNRKTLIHRLVLWGMYIYIYVSCLFFENNYIYIYIYISSYACRFFQKNCTSKSFAEISLYLSHQASLKKDSHIPAHLKNMSMVESQRAPHAYRHASWRALCEGPGRAVCVAGSQNHIISK